MATALTVELVTSTLMSAVSCEPSSNTPVTTAPTALAVVLTPVTGQLGAARFRTLVEAIERRRTSWPPSSATSTKNGVATPRERLGQHWRLQGGHRSYPVVAPIWNHREVVPRLKCTPKNTISIFWSD